MPSQARVSLVAAGEILWDLGSVQSIAGPQGGGTNLATLTLTNPGLWLFEARISTDAQVIVPTGWLADVSLLNLAAATKDISLQWVTDAAPFHCKGVVEAIQAGDILRVRCLAAGVPAGINAFVQLCAVFLGNR